MSKKKIKKSEKGINPFSNYFSFKNPETADILLRNVSECEGYVQEEVGRYLRLTHMGKKAQLLLDAHEYIKVFWEKRPELALSDVIGLFQVALTEYQVEALSSKDKLKEDMLQNDRKML